MKIKINPLAEGINDNERKYLTLLEFHEGFHEGVAEIRSELGIPANQLDDNGIIIYDANQLPNPAKLQRKAFELVGNLELPVTLVYSVESYIQWNQVMGNTQPITVLHIGTQFNRNLLYDPQFRSPPSKIEIATRGSQILENWYKSNREKLSSRSIEPAYPLIQINKPLTQPELIKAIKEKGNWDAIQQAMDYFENSIPYNLKIESFSHKEIEMGAEIYRLRNQTPQKSFKEVYEILTKEHKTNFTDQGIEVKRKYFKFRQLLVKLKFIKL